MSDLPVPSSTEFVIYQTEDGQTHIQVRLDGGTIWLAQSQMVELFQSSKANISEHIKHIFEEGEIDPMATVRRFRTVQTEGARQVEREIDHYNLDVIIAVGYRVRSHSGTQFRQWATGVLSEYVIKGFALDDERLKDIRNIGADYFDELLERIRDIRASERRFYQKITDIYATSADYDADSTMTQQFFKTVQNKMHWAIHGQTAAEVIYNRVDADKTNMGLTTWKNVPKGKIRKADVDVAKNYLSHDEISALNRIVSMYLDYADDMARRRKPMYMKDWTERLDAFLQFNERDILSHAGKISAELAKHKAEAEFAKYDARRRELEATQPTSDFDRFVERTKRLPKRESDGE
ncbi:MAG: virulence RhuM family protein [Armatimonadetes bacterium]|nr:virulence RhuM family protein [Armatimonadota bacterium]